MWTGFRRWGLGVGGWVFAVAGVALMAGGLVWAADGGETVLHRGARVMLVADDGRGRLLVRIDGEDAAFVDGSGLHVRKGLHYGDAVTDYGRNGFDTAAKGDGHAR